MWHLFKKKSQPFIVWDFPLYDIHSHVLWSVDDGARSESDSVAFIEQYARLGYQGVVATPHTNHVMFETPAEDDLIQKLDRLQPHLLQHNLKIKIGAEIMCRADYISQFDAAQFPGIANTFLVEFENRPGVFSRTLEHIVFKLQAGGRVLVLAHPERYVDIQSRPDILQQFKDRGMLMQINLGSLAGKYGERTKGIAWRLVENGIADIASTDLHQMSDFEIVSDALARLAQFDPRRFRTLVSVNPRHVFNGTVNMIE